MNDQPYLVDRWPSPELLREQPNWVHAPLPEGEEDREETIITAEHQQEMVSNLTAFTHAKVTFAGGSTADAILQLLEEAPISAYVFDGEYWHNASPEAKARQWIPRNSSWLCSEGKLPAVLETVLKTASGEPIVCRIEATARAAVAGAASSSSNKPWYQFW